MQLTLQPAIRELYNSYKHTFS